jgi:hypothetical protein
MVCQQLFGAPKLLRMGGVLLDQFRGANRTDDRLQYQVEFAVPLELRNYELLPIGIQVLPVLELAIRRLACE